MVPEAATSGLNVGPFNDSDIVIVLSLGLIPVI